MPSRPARTLLLLLALLPSCDRGNTPTPPPPSAPPENPTPDDPTQKPEDAFRVTPPSSPPSPADNAPKPAAPRFLVAGHELPLPPARLRLGEEGELTLVADSTTSSNPASAPPNALSLTFTPDTDGARPWKHAVYSMELASLEPETPDGLYVGSADNHLRPARLDIELFRDTARPGTVTVLLRGELIPADAVDLAQTPRFPLEAHLEATLERP